jgi:hypothetical protein
MNEKTSILKCPVCGADMKISKPASGTPPQWIRLRCTCGHSEARKDDGTEASMPHVLMAVDGFKEFPSQEK